MKYTSPGTKPILYWVEGKQKFFEQRKSLKLTNIERKSD